MSAIVYAVLSLLIYAQASFAQGITGRASQGGVLVDGVEVRAYQAKPGTFGPLTGEKIAGRTFTGSDGTYRIELPAGRYVVEAVKKGKGNTAEKPQPGDVYCLYSGSPVNVVAGKWTTVGLYLVEVEPEFRDKADSPTIKGTLVFKGKLVEKSYLYLYSSPDGVFRGPADLLHPVGDGSFSVRVPPGTYYLVARKRMQGGSYGPISAGDLFNFYPLNPLVISKNELVRLEFPLIERLDQLEYETGAYKGVKITVVDTQGKPQKGKFILAYSAPGRSGPPTATAGPTGADGSAYLNAPPDGRFLRIRSSIGGPPEENEIFTDAELKSGLPELKIATEGRN